jgi:predicted secreted protein
MRRISIVIIALSLSFFVTAAYTAEKEAFKFTKQPELQQVKPKKPVKIKLRRSAKDEYTWELTGDDAEEIIRTDKRLRKMLNQ